MKKRNKENIQYFRLTSKNLARTETNGDSREVFTRNSQTVSQRLALKNCRSGACLRWILKEGANEEGLYGGNSLNIFTLFLIIELYRGAHRSLVLLRGAHSDCWLVLPPLPPPMSRRSPQPIICMLLGHHSPITGRSPQPIICMLLGHHSPITGRSPQPIICMLLERHSPITHQYCISGGEIHV